MARQKRQFMRQGVADLLTRASVLAYVGAPAEPIFDGERLRIHDGATPGGIPLARIGRRPVADQNASAAAADSYIAITTLTAGRTISLPPAASFAPGQPLYIADESGACSADTGLTITVSASGSDTIAGLPFIVMGSPYQKLAFHSNGSNLWTYA